MQEIISADAIQADIQEDAKKKAELLLEEAEEEAAKAMSEAEARAGEVVDEIFRTNEAKSVRYRMETMARFPLERTRMRAVFIEARLREALDEYMAGLGEERVAALAEAMLAKGASFFAGKAVVLANKGLSEKAARIAAERHLAAAASLEFVEEEGLPAPGFVARAKDGSLILNATMDLVGERLLDLRRVDLARALCPEAVAL
jgi:vacuolar-type H+-ATPase subunit E/Vma4